LMKGEVVACIMYSKSFVGAFPMITFGPVAVTPSLQGRGIGSLIIQESLKRASKSGYKGVIIQGHPIFYERLGFKYSKLFHISNEMNQYPKGQLVLELQPNALDNVNGSVAFSSVFDIKSDEVEAIEKTLPPKPKFKTRSQEMFELVVGLQADDPYPEDFDPKLCFDNKTPANSSLN